MTIVIIKNSNDHIQAYSDSKVTGQSKLTDAATKIFPLPVTIYNPLQKPVFRRSFGFAYAGSSLIAHSIFSFSAAALQTLRVDLGGKLPSLEDVARFVALITEEYVHEIGSNQNSNARVEVAVFGYCPQSERKRAFKISPKFLPNQVDLVFEEIDIRQPDAAYFLGDPDAVDALVKLQTTSKIAVGEALQQLIEAKQHPSIGGDVQVFRIDKKGARHLPTLHRGSSGAHLRLLGKKIEELGPLGDCHFRNEAWLIC